MTENENKKIAYAELASFIKGTQGNIVLMDSFRKDIRKVIDHTKEKKPLVNLTDNSSSGDIALIEEAISLARVLLLEQYESEPTSTLAVISTILKLSKGASSSDPK